MPLLQALDEDRPPLELFLALLPFLFQKRGC